MTIATLRARIVRRLTRGGRHEGRFNRYTKTFLLGTVAIWGISAAYLALTPKSYTSAFVFVLPGTGAGSSVNLDSLGQATTMSASAYATPDVSPTENYRKMLLSHRVLAAAAAHAGLPEGAFPAPRIDLAEQTKLIMVSITGRSPDAARGRAEALRAAFLMTLDALRTEEISARDTASLGMLNTYRNSLEQARARLIRHQVQTGLVSLEQYSNEVSQVQHLRENLQDVDAKLAEAQAGIAGLTRVLGTTPDEANLAMVLRSDPVFQAGIEQLAKDDADIAALSGTRGEANPKLHDLRGEHAAIEQRLRARAGELTGHARANILHMADLSLRDERAQLFQRLVGQLADATAMSGLHDKLSAQIEMAQARVVSRAQDASRLDDLKRDVQVAETVFSSALARIGTSKADFFASYPMVQTLEPPTLPDRPSAPVKALALAGAFAATIFLALALVMTWLRTHLLQRLLKSGSSSSPSPSVGFGISWEPST